MNLNFAISYLPSGSYGGDWLPILLPILLVVWLGSLAIVLGRPDFDSITRLTWVIVLIFVPCFGIVLYWAIAPPVPRRIIDTSNDRAGTPWENNPGHTTKSG